MEIHAFGPRNPELMRSGSWPTVTDVGLVTVAVWRLVVELEVGDLHGGQVQRKPVAGIVSEV